MQRYTVYLESDDIGHYEIVEQPQPDGEWVRAEEALARIAELEEDLQAYVEVAAGESL